MSCETEITESQEWLRLVRPNGQLEFWKKSEISPEFARAVNPLLKFTVATGFGVFDGWDWHVYDTQDKADEAYEFFTEGRIYSAEAA